MSTAREQLAVIVMLARELLDTQNGSWDETQVRGQLRMELQILDGLAPSLRAPQSGPWRVSEVNKGTFYVVRDQWPQHGDGSIPGSVGYGSEAEAIAVCDALNRVAGSGAETPPQPTEEQNGRA